MREKYMNLLHINILYLTLYAMHAPMYILRVSMSIMCVVQKPYLDVGMP